MHIGFVSPAQQESLVDLLCEVNAYYNPDAPAGRDVVRDHAVRNLLSPGSPHRVVVATTPGDQVIGLAAIALVHSFVEPEPGRRSHCQLKELYVSASRRSGGVGRALMAWVAAYAQERGCHRIDWPVKAGNAKGIAFYKGLGATQVEDRLAFRLAGQAVARLAATNGRTPPGI
jgi:GNAT superfamily N-acetyltransferase